MRKRFQGILIIATLVALGITAFGNTIWKRRSMHRGCLLEVI